MPRLLAGKQLQAFSVPAQCNSCRNFLNAAGQTVKLLDWPLDCKEIGIESRLAKKEGKILKSGQLTGQHMSAVGGKSTGRRFYFDYTWGVQLDIVLLASVDFVRRLGEDATCYLADTIKLKRQLKFAYACASKHANAYWDTRASALFYSSHPWTACVRVNSLPTPKASIVLLTKANCKN